jgi:DNA-binding PucR family transcriptional regulator
MDEQYTPEFVYETFQQISQGLYTNAQFSHANVVMISREHYDVLQDAWEEVRELKRQVSALKKQTSDDSWITNPDRMGGAFTSDELNDTGWK